MTILFDDFLKVDIRKGTVTQVEAFPESRNPSLKVWVDFGEDLGVKKTSAQITDHYDVQNLLGKPVMGCVNLGERQIGPFRSEFLLLGFEDKSGAIALASLEKAVPDGKRLG